MNTKENNINHCRKKISKMCIILYISISLMPLLTGCGAEPSLKEKDVRAYFTRSVVPEDMEFTYEDGDGMTYLKKIYEGSSSKQDASITVSRNRYTVKGLFNGKWLYGIGTRKKVLILSGTDKEAVYELMQGYMETFR